MSAYKLTREEQETTIQGNAASQQWEVVTEDPRIIRKMERQGYKPNSERNPWGYISYTVPFTTVRIGKAVSIKRPNSFSGRGNLHVKTDHNQIFELVTR